VREIEASTARSVAVLAASTTIFGLLNLLVTGWTIKSFGVKIALLISVFWPAARLAVQNVGVMTGGNTGILIVQASQVITIIGGPNGYVLALNSFITDVVKHEERTGAIGRLQGCMLVGAAVGFLIGGLIGDAFGILAPFRITLCLFLLSCLYILLTLPSIPPERGIAARQTNTGFARFIGPLRVFTPQKWILADGRSSTQFGALTLGTGVFLAILATGYIPTLLQMYSTDEFHFGTRENGLLIFMYSSLRGLYLTLVFPHIISIGRKWMRSEHSQTSQKTMEEEEALLQPAPISPNQIGPVDPMDNDNEPTNPPPRESEETFAFDLLYARVSLITDGILTGLAMLVSQGWQMYLIAAILPLAAGTGSASKGTILQMIPSNERVDALAGITLVENIARLSTTAVFGLVFAALAEVGKSWVVFGCNAAVALVGFIVLCLSRFPPEGSRRADQ
jgi:MFS family permease